MGVDYTTDVTPLKIDKLKGRLFQCACWDALKVLVRHFVHHVLKCPREMCCAGTKIVLCKGLVRSMIRFERSPEFLSQVERNRCPIEMDHRQITNLEGLLDLILRCYPDTEDDIQDGVEDDNESESGTDSESDSESSFDDDSDNEPLSEKLKRKIREGKMESEDNLPHKKVRRHPDYSEDDMERGSFLDRLDD